MDTRVTCKKCYKKNGGIKKLGGFCRGCYSFIEEKEKSVRVESFRKWYIKENKV